MALFNRFSLASIIYFDLFPSLLGHVAILYLLKLVLLFCEDLHLWYLSCYLLHFRLCRLLKQVEWLLFVFSAIGKRVIRIDQKWHPISLFQTVILKVVNIMRVFLGLLRIHATKLLDLSHLVDLFTIVLVFYFLNLFVHEALVSRFCCFYLPRVP